MEMFNRIKIVMSRIRVKIALDDVKEEKEVDYKMLQELLMADKFLQVINKENLYMSITPFFGVLFVLLESMNEKEKIEVFKCLEKNIDFMKTKILG